MVRFPSVIYIATCCWVIELTLLSFPLQFRTRSAWRHLQRSLNLSLATRWPTHSWRLKQHLATPRGLHSHPLMVNTANRCQWATLSVPLACRPIAPTQVFLRRSMQPAPSDNFKMAASLHQRPLQEHGVLSVAVSHRLAWCRQHRASTRSQACRDPSQA